MSWIVESRCAIATVVRPRMSTSSASRMMISVSVSTLDVASSSTSTGRSNASARANESSCFCPTDSDAPRSPSTVSRPAGSWPMNRSARTAAAARATSSSPSRVSPRRMFAAMLPENRCTSCSTRPNIARTSSSARSRMSIAVHQDAPLADVVEPHQQVDERRLAGAGGADDPDAPAGKHLERDVAQHVVLAVVGEPDVIEHDVRRLARGRAAPAPRAT